MADQPAKIAFVVCGALAREVIAIARRLRELIPQFERVVVVYGDCGTAGRLDKLLERYNVPRIAGPHCYEMYGGATFESRMAEEPGTFFLTDFLVRSFEGTVVK